MPHAPRQPDGGIEWAAHARTPVSPGSRRIVDRHFHGAPGEIEAVRPDRRRAQHKRALDALSAMVSTREIFQSRIRLSTISMAGSTKATARNISATWGSSTSRSLPSTSATSASAFGCSKPSGAGRAVAHDHVRQQGAIVRLGHAQLALHRHGGQADLAADEPPPRAMRRSTFNCCTAYAAPISCSGSSLKPVRTARRSSPRRAACARPLRWRMPDRWHVLSLGFPFSMADIGKPNTDASDVHPTKVNLIRARCACLYGLVQ